MSLAIRMSRGGSKKRPFYHIVVADSRSPRDGRYVEKIGFFNPMVPKESTERMRIDYDRAKYWLSVGAKPSDRVAKFLAAAEIMEPRPIPKQTKKHLPSEKTLERNQAREEKRKEQEELMAAATAEPEAPAEETPATEDTPEAEAVTEPSETVEPEAESETPAA